MVIASSFFKIYKNVKNKTQKINKFVTFPYCACIQVCGIVVYGAWWTLYMA